MEERGNIYESDTRMEKDLQYILNLKPYTTFDHIFQKQRAADPERFWFLKSCPLNLEPSEILCPPLTLSSLLQEEGKVLVNRSVDPNVLDQFLHTVVSSQPLTPLVLRRNALQRIKPSSYREAPHSNPVYNERLSTDGPVHQNQATPSTFRVSLASGTTSLS